MLEHNNIHPCDWIKRQKQVVRTKRTGAMQLHDELSLHQRLQLGNTMLNVTVDLYHRQPRQKKRPGGEAESPARRVPPAKTVLITRQGISWNFWKEQV